MVEWQKLAIKTIGDDVSGNFASNVGIAALSDNFTSYPNQANADAFWPATNPLTRVNVSTDVMDWDFRASGSNSSTHFDIFEFLNLNEGIHGNGNWAMRWQQTFGSSLTGPDSNIDAGWVGLGDMTTQPPDSAQDFIFFYFEIDSSDVRSIHIQSGDNARPDTPTTDNTFTKTFADDETLYFELKRTSPTTIEGTIYFDADYSIIIEKIKVTGVSTTIEHLRHCKILGLDVGTFNGKFDGTIDDVEIFQDTDGVQDFFTVKGNDKATTFDIFPDLITGQVTPSFESDFSSATGWSTDGGGFLLVRPETEDLFFLLKGSSGRHLSNDILGVTVSDTAWVLRGTFNQASVVDGTSADKKHFIGMFDLNRFATDNTIQDGIFLEFVCNSSLGDHNQIVRLMRTDGQFPRIATTVASFDYEVLSPFFEQTISFELKRTSATTVEATIFGPGGFDDPLQTVSGTVPAGIVDLRFIKLMNEFQGDNVSVQEGTYQELDFWDGVTEVCTFNTTPVLEIDSSQSRLNYCQSSIFYSGIEDNTNNSITVDLTPSNISDSGFVIRCKIDVVDNNIAASNDPFHWIGLFGSTAGASGSVAQSGIALRADPVAGTYSPSHGVGVVPDTGWTNETAFTDLTITNGAFFLEIVRLTTTRVRMSLYRDELFNDLIESRTFAISSSLIDLRFWGIKNRVGAPSTAFWEIIVTNIQVWDNINNVDNFAGFRSLDVQIKSNALNGIIQNIILFNGDDELIDYSNHTSINGATDLRTSDRGLDLEETSTASDHYLMMVVKNQVGKNTQIQTYDQVQANTFGPANVPDRIEAVGIWRNVALSSQIGKIEVRNKLAGDYDTDSEIVVFGTD